MTPAPELLDFAEAPNRTLLPAPGIGVHDNRRFLLVLGACVRERRRNRRRRPGPPASSRVRALVPPEIPPMWWLGPSTRPLGAKARLLALGLREPAVPRLEAMITTASPDPGDPAIEVELVTTLAEFAVAAGIRWDAFDLPPERRELERTELDAVWAANRENCRVFLARVDGRPAATATSILGEHGSFLVGGCVTPWARGRGAYRALVRARWEDAVGRDRPALVVHANPATSARILRRNLLPHKAPLVQ